MKKKAAWVGCSGGSRVAERNYCCSIFVRKQSFARGVDRRLWMWSATVESTAATASGLEDMLPWLGRKRRINLDWEGAPRVMVEGEAWLWPVSSMANPSFSSGETPTKMVERCERWLSSKTPQHSLCSSATETSGSRRGPRYGKLRRAPRLLGLGIATVRLTARGLRRWFGRRQTKGEYFTGVDSAEDRERSMAQRPAALAEEAEVFCFCCTEPLSVLNERSISGYGFVEEESTGDDPREALIS
ncbi:hypothetical protein GW17_00055769 [Ensete ventricosum]|nr:hypothetical protein GW17_00055769 [Ensete ventricosum]